MKMKPYECSECGKSFSRKCNLYQHKATHSDNRPFQCTSCHKKFKLKTNRNAHYRSVHMKIKPFECFECGKSFSLKGNLNQHKATHSDNRPFQCTSCNIKFKSKKYLNAHYRSVHMKIKPFECFECGKSFSWKSNLNRHKASHTASHPFQSTSCHKKFKLKSALYAHCKRNYPEPVQCLKFSENLSTKLYKDVHEETHSENPFFQCEICQRLFKKKHAIKTHVKKVHLRTETQNYLNTVKRFDSQQDSNDQKSTHLNDRQLNTAAEVLFQPPDELNNQNYDIDSGKGETAYVEVTTGDVREYAGPYISTLRDETSIHLTSPASIGTASSQRDEKKPCSYEYVIDFIKTLDPGFTWEELNGVRFEDFTFPK